MNVSDQAKIKSNTGNATIKQQGHTDSGTFGSDVSAQPKGHGTPKELHINAKG